MLDRSPVSSFLPLVVLALGAGCALEAEVDDDLEVVDPDDPSDDDLAGSDDLLRLPTADETLEEPDDTVANFNCAYLGAHHTHYVDWGSTIVRPQHPSNPGFQFTTYYGHRFCQRNSASGISYAGYWWVYGYSVSVGAWGWIRINALNGH
jgi:hypothetical protein